MRHDRETTNPIIRNVSTAITVMYWSFLNLETHADPLDRMVWQAALPSTSPLSAIAYGNGQFVAVGGTYGVGVILASPDGVNWTSRRSSTDLPVLTGIAFGDGLFAAVGGNGSIITSPEGANWTLRTSGTQMAMLTITYGNGLFLALRSDFSFLTSADGVNWTAGSSGKSSYLNGVAYGNGLYVAVGGTNILTSPDGLLWTRRDPRITNESGGLRGVAFGEGLFAAVGVFGIILTSPDGEKWTAEPLGTDTFLATITYGGGRFVAMGAGGTPGSAPVVTSPDGKVWAQTSVPIGRFSSYLQSAIAYGNGRFVAVGNPEANRAFVWTSDNGVDWPIIGTSVTAFLEQGYFSAITYANGKFAMVGATTRILTSPDGLIWNATASFPGYFSAITSGNGRFVAVGTRNDMGRLTSLVATSSDGEDWATLRLSKPVAGVGYGNGQFVGVGDAGTIATSPDGTNWMSRESGTTNSLSGAAYGNGQYVAVGANGTIMSSVDAVAWTGRNSGTTNWLRGSTYGNGLFVVTGADGTFLTSPDGETWKRRDSGTTSALSNVTFGNDIFVAVADNVILMSRDGLTWTQTTLETTSSSVIGGFPLVSGVAYGDGRFVAVGTRILRADVAQPILWDPRVVDSAFALSITGEIGRAYRIQAATTLVSPAWVDLGGVTNDQVKVPFVDSRTDHPPNRFYRAVLVP
jgi:hypothetical protein